MRSDLYIKSFLEYRPRSLSPSFLRTCALTPTLSAVLLTKQTGLSPSFLRTCALTEAKNGRKLYNLYGLSPSFLRTCALTDKNLSENMLDRGLSPSFLRTCALTCCPQSKSHIERRVSVLLSLEHALWQQRESFNRRSSSCLSPSFLRTCALTISLPREGEGTFRRSQSFFP